MGTPSRRSLLAGAISVGGATHAQSPRTFPLGSPRRIVTKNNNKIGRPDEVCRLVCCRRLLAGGPSAISRTSKISAVECRLTGVGPPGVSLGGVWYAPFRFRE